MVMFRILAIGVWIFALLIFVGGLSTDFLTCTIVALIIALNTLIPSSQSPGARRVNCAPEVGRGLLRVPD